VPQASALTVKEIMPSTDKKGEIMSWENYCHRCQVRVRFGDTDPYGIVYFVSYFRYCHQAIEDYLRSLGLPPEDTFRNVKEGFGLPIVEAHGKFIRPSRYGDLLEIETRVQEVRTKAIIFHFRFFPAGQDELMAEGTANMVAISREWRAIPIPNRVLSRLIAAGQPAGQLRERG
jgi:YbgC/YbaW family acyl-CoA thioester hydrolase